MNLLEMAEEERRLLLAASDRYGRHFEHAAETTLLLSNLVWQPVTQIDNFLRFYTQVKTHHTLSLFSSARRHRVQSKLALRYCFESASHAGFCLANRDLHQYVNPVGEVVNPQTATSRVYSWMRKHYKSYSDTIQESKDYIQRQLAHANVANSIQTYRAGPDAVEMPFFDFEDEDVVKIDMVLCGQAALLIIDYLMTVRREHGGFLPQVGAEQDFHRLSEENTSMLKSLMSQPRWAEFHEPEQPGQ